MSGNEETEARLGEMSALDPRLDPRKEGGRKVLGLCAV